MKMPDPITTAHQLVEARKAANLTQLELADHLAVSRNTVNRLESGQMVIQPHTARHMAFLFAWLAQTSGAPAKPKKSRYDPRKYYNFTTLDGKHLNLEALAALPPGTHYRVQENLKGWQTCVRGHGTRHEDEAVGSAEE